MFVNRILTRAEIYAALDMGTIGAFDMDCGCMKRPARVAACSRGGVENGSFQLLVVCCDQALFAYVTLFIIKLSFSRRGGPKPFLQQMFYSIKLFGLDLSIGETEGVRIIQ